ncbi:MAG: lipid-A-disaccharide synthase [Bacteroidales bacterium]|jgi:lipid-A-disaccharide synthase|nr:lipid-A-disaccharide synthase [Bacteroidales bacterium]
MKYFIVAGEQSGDLHGSNLVRELIAADREAEIACWGGDLMEAAGARLLMHYRKTAFMGFVVVLRNLRTIARNLKLSTDQIKQFRPDTVILIDYPGFNLRIAKNARKDGFRVFYYISPKFWAWNEGRVRKVEKYVDRMYIIFPFEKEFYAKHGIAVEYYGNPLVDEIEKRKSSMPPSDQIRRSMGLDGRPVIAMLSGSRRHEVQSILPAMVRTVRHFPGYQFILAAVSNIPDDTYNLIIGDAPVKLFRDKTYEILTIAEAALIKSGTSTLEAALLGVPQVVCYRGDFLSMLIAWLVMKVKYVSLVNLIMNGEVVKELLGYSLNEKNLVRELGKILIGGNGREKILKDYTTLRDRLGGRGASERIASEMIRELRKSIGETASGK